RAEDRAERAAREHAGVEQRADRGTREQRAEPADGDADDRPARRVAGLLAEELVALRRVGGDEHQFLAREALPHEQLHPRPTAGFACEHSRDRRLHCVVPPEWRRRAARVAGTIAPSLRPGAGMLPGGGETVSCAAAPARARRPSPTPPRSRKSAGAVG